MAPLDYTTACLAIAGLPIPGCRPLPPFRRPAIRYARQSVMPVIWYD